MREKPSLKALLLFGLLVIFVASAIAREGREDVNAGQILNDSDAKQKCENVRASFQNRNTDVDQARWTGQWTSNGSTSVCGIRYISRGDWKKKSINKRPMTRYEHYSDCADTNKIENGWIYDDICRDKLIMNYSELKHVIVVNKKEDIANAADSRYIFVLRSYDNELILRRYDRSHDKIFPNSNYDKCDYDKYLDSGNKTSITEKDIPKHVRHSQLNGSYFKATMDFKRDFFYDVKTNAWDSVWSAGELWIKKGKITDISNNSGHFQPPFESLQYVKETLTYYGIPTDNINLHDIVLGKRLLTQLEDACLGGEKKKATVWDPWD